MTKMYRVSRCPNSPKKRKLKKFSTWTYDLVNNKDDALKLAKEWKEQGYYVKIEVIINETK